MARRRGLIRSAARTAGRTAVIAGTATAVSGRVARRQADAHSHRQGPDPEAHRGGPVVSTCTSAEAALVRRLHQLADLKAMGALTEKEFVAAKTKLLND